MLKRIVKIAALTGTGLFLLIILLAILTQTAFFRAQLRDYLIASLTEALNGTIIIGTIEGNIVSGFSIDSVRIEQDGKPLLSAGRIVAYYDPIPLIQKELRLKYLILEQPKIYLERRSTGEWNIGRLVKPSRDTVRGTFEWNLFFDDVQLKNATVSLVDSVGLLDSTHRHLDDTYVEYHHFTLRDLNLQVNGHFTPLGCNLDFTHCSFYSEQPRFELTHAQLKLEADTTGFNTKDLIIQSGRSYMELDAGMRGINIFKGIDLAAMKNDSTRISLKSTNLDLAELRSFLPWVHFVDGILSIEMDASGQFGNLTVQRLNLNAFRSSLKLSGNIRNLDRPNDLMLDLLVGDSNVDPGDLQKLLPGLMLPPFRNVGNSVVFASFRGKPDNFVARASLRSRAGDITLDGSLNFASPQPAYDLAFTTRNLSLSEWTGNPELNSSISSSGRLKGSGLTIGTLHSTLSAELDTSRFRNILLTPSTLTVTADSKKVRIEGTLTAGAMAITVSGNGNFSNEARPAYDAAFSFTNVDLATLFEDEKYRSRLTLQGSGFAQGSTIDDLSGDVALRLLPSTFGSHSLGPEDITFRLDQRSVTAKHLSLHSSIADIDLAGRFDLDLAIAALGDQSRNLVSVVESHALPPDSVARPTTPPTLHLRPHTHIERQLDFDYTIEVKNLEPIANLFDEIAFDAHARIQGTIHGTDEVLSFSSQGNIEELYVGSPTNNILLDRTNVAVTIDSLSQEQTLEQLFASVRLSIASGLINGRHLDSLSVAIDYNAMKGTLAISGVLDSTYSIVASGKTSVQPNTYVCDVETLLVASRDYRWQNNQDVQFRLNYEGTRIMHAVMERGDEEFSIAGILRHNGEFDIKTTLRNYDIRGIGVLEQRRESIDESNGFSGRANADLTLMGSLSDPLITFSVLIESTYYRSTRIGTVNGAMSYANQNAIVDITVRETPDATAPSLAIKGTVPVNLSFEGVEERFPDEPQQMQIHSDRFDVSALDPLIRELDEMSGALSCDIVITGTPRNPEYDGKISLSDVRFLFVPNNIAYIMSGDLEPTGERLVLKDVTVRNLPGEQANGEAHFTGSITIRDFKIQYFDLTMVGQLLVMSDATKKILPTMYGPLFAQTDDAGLNLRGTLEQPYLSGKLYILNQNITFPPTKVSEANEKSTTLQYVMIDDTSKPVAPSEEKPRRFFTITTPVEQAGPKPEMAEPALLERLRYNLVIETKGTTAIRMIFTPATSEELYAELEGKLNAVNERGTPSIYGDIEITRRSYYTFFKKFDATGKLRFYGPWDNPELDINATYQSIRSVDSIQQPVRVELHITGTRYEPRLDMAMKIQLERGGEWVDWSTQARGGDVQSDAISFILTNKFKDDLTSRERAGIQSSFVSTTGGSMVSGFTSTLLSGIFDDFVKKEFPFIRSVEVSYGGGNIQEGADVRLSGEAFKGYFRFGGKILNNVGNANVSYLLSLGDVFSAPAIRNLFLQLERRVETDVDERDKETKEARLYYRFSF